MYIYLYICNIHIYIYNPNLSPPFPGASSGSLERSDVGRGAKAPGVTWCHEKRLHTMGEPWNNLCWLVVEPLPLTYG